MALKNTRAMLVVDMDRSFRGITLFHQSLVLEIFTALISIDEKIIHPSLFHRLKLMLTRVTGCTCDSAMGNHAIRNLKFHPRTRGY